MTTLAVRLRSWLKRAIQAVETFCRERWDECSGGGMPRL